MAPHSTPSVATSPPTPLVGSRERERPGPPSGGPGDGRIAWEAGLGPWAGFWRTFVGTLFIPARTFEALGRGRARASLLYAALCFTLVAVLGWAVAAVRSAVAGGAIAVDFACFSVVAAPLLGVAHALWYGSLLHLGARALGGRGTLAAGIRGAAYSGSVAVVVLLSHLAPVGLGSALVVMGLLLTFVGVALAGTARGSYDLSPGRAALAAAFPMTVSLGLVLATLLV